MPYEQVDLADSAAAERAVSAIVAANGGRLDGVFTAAGIDSCGPLDQVPVADWERVIKVNLLGTAAVIRAALPYLKRSKGRVVTCASTLGIKAVGDATAYCASKFGVVGFTRALAAETAGEVGVTLLIPGGMHTPFFDGRTEQYKPPADANSTSRPTWPRRWSLPSASRQGAKSASWWSAPRLRGPGPDVRHVLILRALGLGDFLTGVPAYRALRSAYPDALLTLAAPAYLEPLIGLTQALDRLHPTKGLGRLGPIGPPPDLAVNLHGRGPASIDDLVATGAGKVITHRHPLRPGVEGPDWRDDLHEVRRWCRLLECKGSRQIRPTCGCRRPKCSRWSPTRSWCIPAQPPPAAGRLNASGPSPTGWPSAATRSWSPARWTRRARRRSWSAAADCRGTAICVASWM